MSELPGTAEGLRRRERRYLQALTVFLGMSIMAPALIIVLAVKDLGAMRRGFEGPWLSEVSGPVLLAAGAHLLGFAGAILTLGGYAIARRRRQESETEGIP